MQTWTVLAGGQAEIEQTEHGPAGAWQLMKFYPSKLTINEGDTVIWKLNSVEMHNVIFPPPGQSYVPFVTPQGNEVVANPLAVFPVGGPSYDGKAVASSGQISMEAPGVQEYRLTFTKAGSFNYLCSIHSAQLPNGQVVGMTGNITVQAAGSALAKTAAQPGMPSTGGAETQSVNLALITGLAALSVLFGSFLVLRKRGTIA